MWNEGDVVLLRGIYDGHLTYVQTTRLVKDTPSEVALLIMPGAECMVPKGYIQHAHDSQWDRWQESLTNAQDLTQFIWHTNRFLVLLEPEKFYSTIYIWEAGNERFRCFYINFQLPFRRSRLGFDTLDLDLDIVIDLSYHWHWKDVNEYERGIAAGAIKPEWIDGIEHAKHEVITRIADRSYPLDGTWLNWRPEPGWTAPCLPAEWHQVD